MSQVKIIYTGASEHNHYRIIDRVYNDRPSRLLLSGDKHAPQSGLALDDDAELLFDYNQRLLEVALSLNPKSILMIGGGAFTLPRALLSHLPKARIDAVEIDQLLPKLAHKYFQLPRSRRLKIHVQDGRDYVNNCRGSYDLIVVDAFSEYDIPRSLLTVEAANQYSGLLAPQGTIALNIIARHRGYFPTLTHKMIESFRSSFGLIEIYPADPSDSQIDEQNLIFVASHAEHLSLDYLMSVQVHPHDLNDESLAMHDSSRTNK